MESVPKVLEKIVSYKGKYRSFYNYKYQNKGAIGYWEVIKSEINEMSGPYGIKAVPIIFKSVRLNISEPHIVLIASHRIPVEGWILEFPSGMANPGETVEQCIKREVLEETGYHIKRVLNEYNSGNTISYTDPWKSDDNEILHIVEVDADDAINAVVKQDLDDFECIVPVMVRLDNLRCELEQMALKNKWMIDSELMGFALGMSISGISVSI